MPDDIILQVGSIGALWVNNILSIAPISIKVLHIINFGVIA
jgi:hypothetical protein